MVREEIQDITAPQEIADNLKNDPYFARSKVNSPEHYEEPVLANIDMELADAAFQREPDYYIGPDDKGISNRKERVMQTIQDGSLRYAPYGSIRMQAGQPVLSFGDGRHRFAVLRDMGVETINMTFDAGSADKIHLLQK